MLWPTKNSLVQMCWISRRVFGRKLMFHLFWISVMVNTASISVLWKYMCPENIKPFWLTHELVAQTWYNLANNQRKHYFIWVSIYSPMGLLSQKWNAFQWDYALRTSYLQWQIGNCPGLSGLCFLLSRFFNLWHLAFP